MNSPTIPQNTPTGQSEARQHAARAEFEPYRLKPRYDCNRSGVFYIGVKTDKDGETSEAPPLLLADPIRLIGRGIDETGNHYRIIEWRDKLTHQTKQAALSAAEIGSNPGWQRLQSFGLSIMSGRAKRERLADYLQTDGAQTAYSVTTRAGWHGNAYILPSGEVIPADNTDQKNKAAHVIYNGDRSQAAAYAVSGSLQEWNARIGRYLAGNSRLCLAAGAALAAPLVSLLGLEAGGFHLFGDSRDGKSTAARLALSIWGDPAALMQTWTGTSHGFTNLANARNDGLLVLDEIGQANPRHVATTAYAVINGISKVQGAKEGGNREGNRWKVMLFSTGEKPLERFVEQGGDKWQAGQAARLPSVPSAAGKGLGIYDTLHGFPNGAAFSEALATAAGELHGHAGRSFIRLLLDNAGAQDTARRLLADFMQTLPELSGQVRTVALRFAATAAALELAARHSIIAIPAGAGMVGIKQCFDDWLARNGTGKYEDARIVRQAADFMQLHAGGQRFSDWDNRQDSTDREHAGYRRRLTAEEADEFWISTPVFEVEICQSYDTDKVCTVLHGIGWLKRNETEKRWQYKKRNAGRFYVLIGIDPPEQAT